MHDVYANTCHGYIPQSLQDPVADPNSGGRAQMSTLRGGQEDSAFNLSPNLVASLSGSHSSSWRKQKRSGGKWGCHMGCINLNMCTASSSLFTGEQKTHAPRELEQEGPQGCAGSRASNYNAVQKTNFHESKACMFIYSTVSSGEATPTSS